MNDQEQEQMMVELVDALVETFLEFEVPPTLWPMVAMRVGNELAARNEAGTL